MLKLTLYKNVILNETYQNVFSLGVSEIGGKTILEKYLDNRPKAIIQLDNVYYENTGQLVLDYDIVDEMLSESEIYDYNYMKCILYNDNEDIILKRYCFINGISIKNGCVYLDYNEDIWSSYSDKIHGITESFLSRLRYKDYSDFDIPLVSIPFDYNGNNKLDIVRFSQDVADENKVMIILEVQAYDLVSGSGAEIPKSRIIGNFMYRDMAPVEDGEYLQGEYKFSLQTAFNKILNLLTYQGYYFAECSHWQAEYSGIHRFEIGNIYILPADYAVSMTPTGSWVPATQFLPRHYNWIKNAAIRVKETDDITIFDYKCFLQRISYNLEGMILKNFTIANNYKNAFLGTLNSYIQLFNNGTNIEAEIKMYASQSNIGIYLNINNQLIDITNSFSYDLPFNMLTSEQVSQRRLSLALKNLNLNYEKDMNKLNTSKNVFNHYTSAMKKAFSGAGKILSGKIISGAGEAMDGFSDYGNIGFDIAKGSITDKKLNEEQTLVNMPVYSDSKGVFGNSLNFLNYVYGVVLFRINSDNDLVIKQIINNFGYVVYNFINDFSKLKLNVPNYFISQGCNYTVVKFESVNVFGSFPRNIALVLNNILTSSVKIWFKETMEDDNYVV